ARRACGGGAALGFGLGGGRAQPRQQAFQRFRIAPQRLLARAAVAVAAVDPGDGLRVRAAVALERLHLRALLRTDLLELRLALADAAFERLERVELLTQRL